MPELNGEWIDQEELEKKILEAWGEASKQFGGIGDALEKLGEAVRAVTDSVDRMSNALDALGPLWDALLDDEEDDSDERGDLPRPDEMDHPW